MNGVHDMGGMHGFGPVDREETGSPFHAPWEGRVGAMMMALVRRRVFNLDEMRRAIESIPPAQYLASTYFERWLTALRMLLEEDGRVNRDRDLRLVEEWAAVNAEASRAPRRG